MSRLDTPIGSSAPVGPGNRTLALFAISVLGLFIELMLIRWVTTEIRVLASMQNIVLVVCFMGLGMGCWTCDRPFVLRNMLLPLSFLVLLLSVPTTRLGFSSVMRCLSIWEDGSSLREAFRLDPVGSALWSCLALACTFFLLVMVWDIFVPVGRLIGRLMSEHPRPIWAYSVNVGGSLLGVWLFVLLSVLYQPPMTWFAVVAGLSVFFLARNRRARVGELALLAVIVGLSWFAGREPYWMEVAWTPYQKLALRETAADRPDGQRSLYRRLLERNTEATFAGIGDYVVMANNGGYQAMVNLDQRHVRANPQWYPPEMRGLSQYDIPLLLHPRPQKMLVVGAGSGNDVAGGLRHGVQHITAVEIDPGIIAAGRRYHPEKPYDSPRVRLVNDDARSFFATCAERYDVIVFGLLDSGTAAGTVNERLDHYVYTRESMQRARSLLADGGILVLSFEVLKPFSPDRMGGTLREVFGQEPICFHIPKTHYGWGGVMFVAGGLEAAKRQIAGNDKLAAMIGRWQKDSPVALPGTTPIVTDDWPYIYLEKPQIPLRYGLLGGLLVVLFLWCLKRLQAPRLMSGWGKPHWHFFFLGAAFMLLEVQNISKASVVLGNTWWVNAVIISGILAMILLANAITARFPRLPVLPVYGLLCVTCVLLYCIDLSRFGFLPYAAKAVAVGGLTSLPMLFSGIVFIRSFAAVRRKDVALGANLMGSLTGGLLQAITFLTGIKALLLVVAGLYLLALISRPRSQAAVPAAPATRHDPAGVALPSSEPALAIR
ncbi:MAG TPA: hypothetical protein VG013_33350 [Gemmataceae bacterium]|nr:hypothetical protein [Gemmataceae bacterium]